MFLRFGRFHGDNQVYGMSGTMQQKMYRTRFLGHTFALRGRA